MQALTLWKYLIVKASTQFFFFFFFSLQGSDLQSSGEQGFRGEFIPKEAAIEKVDTTLATLGESLIDKRKVAERPQRYVPEKMRVDLKLGSPCSWQVSQIASVNVYQAADCYKAQQDQNKRLVQ